MADQSNRKKVSLRERLQRPGARKLLALDGGGIRGVLSLEILRKLESVLRTASGRADYRLADYFDYISGTSTGGIIASITVHMTSCHSVSASEVTIILRMPMTMVCMSSRVVMSSGQRYWFQP